MTKVLICTRSQAEFKELVEKSNLPGIDLYAPESEEDLLRHIVDAEVIFANPILLSKYINKAKNVKWVQSSFAWIDALNNESLQKEYLLTNMRDTYWEIIAEYILGYILMLEKDILWHRKNQKTKTWGQKSHPSIVWKKIWIMWIGSIWWVVAKYCKNFQMQVYWYASQAREQDSIDMVYTIENRDEFLSELDYLVSILPNTNETKGIINSDLLWNLPHSAVFINVGRGANVVEEDLIKAVKDNTIAWAVLDVFDTEPLPEISELWNLENVYITPHVSWYVEDNSKIISTFVENYKRYVWNKELMHTIDFNKGY